MYCPSCGAENAESSQYCESCGALIGAPSPATDSSEVSSVSQEIPAEGRTYARIAVIFGIVGIILFFFFFFGLIAVILGYVGYKKGDQKTGKIAMILGAVGIVLFLIGPVLLGGFM